MAACMLQFPVWNSKKLPDGFLPSFLPSVFETMEREERENSDDKQERGEGSSN